MMIMLGTFTACDNDSGNVVTVKKAGSEEELTAIRENLIKYKEIDGFGDIDKMEFYENGVRTTSDEYVQVKDDKKFYYSGDKKRVVNYTDGYILDMPADWIPNFTVSSARCEYKNDEVTLVVSDETDALSIYGGAEEVLEATFRFIGTDEYITKNRIEKISDETITFNEDFSAYILKMHLKECPEGTKNYYTYVVFYNDLKITYMMFKCVDDRDFADVYSTYQSIYEKGAAEWITEMFDCFEQNRFPNIKSAVWFNGNDYDSSGNITHEIALGRDVASREAFKEGLDRTQ